MAGYYDDNYGEYRIEDEDDLEFYRQVQRSNVVKKCQGCGRRVKIQPQYGYCNACATRMEHGLDVG